MSLMKCSHLVAAGFDLHCLVQNKARYRVPSQYLLVARLKEDISPNPSCQGKPCVVYDHVVYNMRLALQT